MRDDAFIVFVGVCMGLGVKSVGVYVMKGLHRCQMRERAMESFPSVCCVLLSLVVGVYCVSASPPRAQFKHQPARILFVVRV